MEKNPLRQSKVKKGHARVRGCVGVTVGGGEVWGIERKLKTE